MQTTDHYIHAEGWEQKPVRAEIIGEENLTYITKIFTEKCWKWIGDKEIEFERETAIGFHKSRLVGWENQQLYLFE